MEIGDQQVNTPYDIDPLDYGADWRYMSARGWAVAATNQVPSVIRQDPDIKAMRDVLKIDDARVSAKSKKLRPYATALSWYNNGAISSTKHQIEALLLTGVPYRIIRDDVGGDLLPEEPFRIYERMFFNMRTKQDKLVKSLAIRTRFALHGDPIPAEGVVNDAVMSRLIGHQIGYAGLCSLWSWHDGHGLDTEGWDLRDELVRAAQAHQLRRVVLGRINNFDLQAVIGHHMDYTRMLHDTGKGTSGSQLAHETVLKMLAMAAPRVVTAAHDIDDKKALQLLEGTFGAGEEGVLGQTINDKGIAAGHELVEKMIANRLNQFSEAM